MDCCMELLEVDSSWGLYVAPLGYGDDERFAALFRETWNMIPAEHRSLLNGLWRERRGPKDLQGEMAPIPRIALLPRQSPGFEQGPSAHAVAQSRLLYTEMDFAAELIDRMPPRLVRTTIAHELAHAFLHVQSSGQHTLDDYSAAEADAREWLHFGWKQSEPGDLFDEFELDDWLGANAEELESD